MEKGKYLMNTLICSIQINKQSKSKHTDKENRVTDGWLLEAVGGRGWK